MTSAADAARAYLDAWNAKDGAAIAASFAPGGIYEDPATEGSVPGVDLGIYAETLWSAIPDLAFEIAAIHAIGEGRAIAEWTMRGTNAGSFRGLPPTGREIALPGIDVFAGGPEGLTAVRGYFDSASLPRQLGLQVIVQPETAGPFRFGRAVHVGTDDRRVPGAFSITKLEARSPGGVAEIQDFARKIANEMREMEGFLGLTLLTVGMSQMTVAAWTDIDAPRRVMADAAHKAASARFFGPELAAGGHTSLWTSARAPTTLLRCDACGRMNRLAGAKAASCECGAALPEPPPFW
ncbi:MAG: ester cyclase [Proteobacteria bacterium]|nr:ester cyclase [Pseudomonadota bacterium]